ncbi:hypothetical protein [Candidatus Phytoplasma sp. AldY-WA1]|nr:hypothetical protein [Candidatus Phytoplasma sp. AldY-WA1]
MITTISCMLFMRTFTFWFILALGSFYLFYSFITKTLNEQINH